MPAALGAASAAMDGAASVEGASLQSRGATDLAAAAGLACEVATAAAVVSPPAAAIAASRRALRASVATISAPPLHRRRRRSCRCDVTFSYYCVADGRALLLLVASASRLQDGEWASRGA
jgi:hypothetical protein